MPPSKRDLLGTVLLSVLSGHYRYAHITTLRCDAVNPRLLGMKKVVSEDAVRRGLAKIDEAAGLTWLQRHLDYCVWPLLSEPWVLDIDSTIKPLYGRQEGAMVGYNPHKPGRPSHCYHTFLMANLRLVRGWMCSLAMNTRPSMARPDYGRCCIGLGAAAGRLCYGVMWHGASSR